MPSNDIQRIIKVGNSHAVVIPAYLLRALDMQHGDKVVLSCVEEGVITVRKVNEIDIRNLRIGTIN